MSNRKVFTKEQGKAIRKEYENRKSLKEVSEIFYCSPKTVKKYVVENGGTIRPKSKGQRSHSPIEMILTDWKTGASVDSICEKYRIPNKVILYHRISQWRRRGFAFEKYRKKSKMNQSEEITAGLISSARWCE